MKTFDVNVKGEQDYRIKAKTQGDAIDKAVLYFYEDAHITKVTAREVKVK